MRVVLAVTACALAGAGFAGGWFAHRGNSQRCYVLPAYTDAGSSNPLLDQGKTVNGPELVCR